MNNPENNEAVSFTIYLPSGRIRVVGSALANQVQVQMQEGDLVIYEASNPSAQYVKDGAIVDMPVRPSMHHDFNYESGQWLFNEASAWTAIRMMRDRLIADSDWRVTRATERGEQLSEQWKSYRQALRDITEQPDPNNIQWPAMPEEGI